MAKDVPSSTRARLRALLEGEIERLEKGKPSQEAEDDWWHLLELVDGLDALDGGVVPAIFAPAKYAKGAETPRLQMKALGFVALLRRIADPAAKGKKKCYTADKAQMLVADAYGRTSEALRSWEKTFKLKCPEELMKAEMGVCYLFHNQILRGWPSGTEPLFRAMRGAGQELHKIQTKAEESRAAAIGKSQGKK